MKDEELKKWLKDKEVRAWKRIMVLLGDEGELRLFEIANSINYDPKNALRILRKLQVENIFDFKITGNVKKWFLTERGSNNLEDQRRKGYLPRREL